MKASRQLRKAIEDSGWWLARHTKHMIWRCPCGEHTVTMSNSPSDHRSIQNTLRDFRRTGCEYQPKWKGR